MSIFPNNGYTGTFVSRYLDGEVSADEEQRFVAALEESTELRAGVERMRRVQEALSDGVDERIVEDAQKRVSAALADSLRYRYRAPDPWWQRQVSLPMPVMAAASVLFFIMAAGLIINPGVLANRYHTAGEIAGNNPVNVQVQVSGAESDLLLRWLDEQNEVGSVTIQLPEHAQFQLRGEPVFLRPSAVTGDEEPLEIVPVEVPAE
jgi:hypothetical protein